MWMLLAAALCAAPTPALRIAVMPTRAGPGASPDMAQLVDVRLGTSLTRHGRLGTIITSEDLNRLTILDNQRRALGCADENCARELGAAFDTSHVLTSVVTVLGDRVLVTVTLVPVDGSSMLRLEENGPNNAEGLLACVDTLVERLEAQAAPAPPPAPAPAPSPAPAPAPTPPPDSGATGLPHHLIGLVGGIISTVAAGLATVACAPLLLGCGVIPWLGTLYVALGACVTCLPVGTILMLVAMTASLPVPVAGFRAAREHLGTARAVAALVLATGGALGAAGIVTLVVGATSLLGSTIYLMNGDGLTTIQNASATDGAYPAPVRVPLMLYMLGVAGCLLGCCALPPAAWLFGAGGVGLGGSLRSRDTLEDEDARPRARKKHQSKRKKKKKHVLEDEEEE